MRRSLPPILAFLLRFSLRVNLPRRAERPMPPWSSLAPEPVPEEPTGDANATWTVGDIATATGVTPRQVVRVARTLGFDALVFDADEAALILSALDGSTPPRAA